MALLLWPVAIALSGVSTMSVCLFLEARTTTSISTAIIYRLTESMGVPLMGTSALRQEEPESIEGSQTLRTDWVESPHGECTSRSNQPKRGERELERAEERTRG